MEKPASRSGRRSSLSYSEPTMVLTVGFTPPLLSAINGNPISSHVMPGINDSAMCPSITTTPETTAFFCAPHAVCQPRAEDGEQIHAAAIRAQNAACQRFINAQAAFGGKALPQFNVKQRDKLDRMPEKKSSCWVENETQRYSLVIIFRFLTEFDINSNNNKTDGADFGFAETHFQAAFARWLFNKPSAATICTASQVKEFDDERFICLPAAA